MTSPTSFNEYAEPERYDQSYRVYGNAIFSQSSSRIDEGYSEDVPNEDLRGHDGNEMETGQDEPMISSAHNGLDISHISPTAMLKLLLSQPEQLRAQFAFDLLQSCRTAQIANVAKRLEHRLHHDPVVYLPPELMFLVFECLPPLDLLNTLAVSKQWRNRALDSRLWQRLYSHEGWTYNHEHVLSVERRNSMHGARRSSDSEIQKNIGEDSWKAKDSIHSSPINDTYGKKTEFMDFDPQATSGQPLAQRTDSADSMEGVTYHSSSPARATGKHRAAPELGINGASNRRSSQGQISPAPKSPLFLRYPSNQFRANWHYIFNLRRRLERNWEAGRFTNFRLPHIDHPQEAHSQCVYTIQYSVRHLVSGSRDRTVRVWNLETQRLLHRPLLGHTGSVLCLQFDDAIDQDVIISGGSDADIIIWRFSTGKLFKRIAHAHSDSVLNLRFDHRYLVTCSKDKTIKVWNRKTLSTFDAEYPSNDVSKPGNARYPDYIIDVADLNKRHEMRNLPPPLAPYTLLMTFDGHGAAVNAIQIYKDQIVSASGDRKIKIWNISNGTEVKTLAAHQKGIACVQYDGRRVVTGSSDSSVKIFDVATGAEVAVLEGHTSLVRSVQAEFGDAPGDEVSQAAEARANDRNILDLKAKAIASGGRLEDAGSPHKYFVFGAKLPPGGGGNRWTKIVSGSYDETLIIWKRDKTGKWFKAKQLHQEDAIRSTGGPLIPPTSSRQHVAHSHHLPGGGVPAPGPQSIANQNHAVAAALAVQQAHRAQLDFMQQRALSQWANQTGTNTNQAQTPMPWMPGSNGLQPTVAVNATQAYAGSSSMAATATHSNGVSGANQPQIAATAALQFQPSMMSNAPSLPALPIQLQQPRNSQPPNPNLSTYQQQQQQLQQYLHHHNNYPTVATAAQAQAPMNRIFKLQFDVRRIICCSQEPIIIGWDFANGDEEIIEASHFFGEPKG